MKVSVAYINDKKKFWLHVDVDHECTALQAINTSGILQQCPEIDLSEQKIGIYGKVIKPEMVIKEGDRVEIYRPITADPKTVKRRDQEHEDM